MVPCDLRAELHHDGLRLDELAHPGHVLGALTRQKPGGVSTPTRSAVMVLRTDSSAG